MKLEDIEKGTIVCISWPGEYGYVIRTRFTTAEEALDMIQRYPAEYEVFEAIPVTENNIDEFLKPSAVLALLPDSLKEPDCLRDWWDKQITFQDYDDLKKLVTRIVAERKLAYSIGDAMEYDKPKPDPNRKIWHSDYSI